MMEQRENFVALVVSWIAAALTFASMHVGAIVSICVGIVSATAGLFAIHLSRITSRLRQKELDAMEEKNNSKSRRATDRNRRATDRGDWQIVLAAMVGAVLLCGCATGKADSVERSLYLITTNYTETVMDSVIVRVVTNETGFLTLQTNSVRFTNVVPTIVLHDKPGVEAALRGAGGAVGDVWGIGGMLAALIGGAYHAWKQARNKQIQKTFVQGIETAREVIKTTPQGEQIEKQFVAWLEENQSAKAIYKAAQKLAADANTGAAQRAAQSIVEDVQPTS